MREIKFRAWIKKESRMAEVQNLGQNGKSIVVDDSDMDGTYNRHFGSNKYELMQYTGLKDENEKEIYEGDIVSIPSAQVRDFTDDTPTQRIIKWNDEDCQFTFYKLDGKKQTSGWCFRQQILNQSEIIGNIYENPELLKQS